MSSRGRALSLSLCISPPPTSHPTAHPTAACAGLCYGWNEDNPSLEGYIPPFTCDVWTPHVTFLRISVYNVRSTLLGRSNSKQLIAQEIVPLQALRHGYRSLQLRSPNGCIIEACKLLLHVQLERLVRVHRPKPKIRRPHKEHRHEKAARQSAWHGLRLSSMVVSNATRSNKAERVLGRHADVKGMA